MGSREPRFGHDFQPRRYSHGSGVVAAEADGGGSGGTAADNRGGVSANGILGSDLPAEAIPVRVQVRGMRRDRDTVVGAGETRDSAGV